MKIHEYRAKEILRKHGVATPRGVPCFSVDEAVAAARTQWGDCKAKGFEVTYWQADEHGRWQRMG